METQSYPYTRILIPYDGSPSAQKALEWAAHLPVPEGMRSSRSLCFG